MSAQLETVGRPFYDDEEDDEEDMTNIEHGYIAMKLGTKLNNHIADKKLGIVLDSSVEYRFLLDKKPKQGRKPYKQPDVSFIKQERLPTRFDVYPEIAPDLAIEVVSPSDREIDIQSKIALYQKYAVKLVWLVQPFSRRVDVYRAATGLIPQPIGENGELNGEDVIPGLKIKLTDIFDYPAPALDEEIAEIVLPQ